MQWCAFCVGLFLADFCDRKFPLDQRRKTFRITGSGMHLGSVASWNGSCWTHQIVGSKRKRKSMSSLPLLIAGIGQRTKFIVSTFFSSICCDWHSLILQFPDVLTSPFKFHDILAPKTSLFFRPILCSTRPPLFCRSCTLRVMLDPSQNTISKNSMKLLSLSTKEGSFWPILESTFSSETRSFW